MRHGPRSELVLTMNPLENIQVRRGHSPQFKKEAVEFYQTHGAGEAALRYRVSEDSLRRWSRIAGKAAKKLGAPKGNLNMLGGRICQTDRSTDQRPLHKNG